MQTCPYSDLTDSQQQLMEAATEAMDKAYNPYSQFYVGAAVRTPNHIFTGSNLENASYGASICAERIALSKAFSEGDQVIREVALIAKADHYPPDKVTSPCGICRQVFFEASANAGWDISFLLSSSNREKIIQTSIEELFPLGFGPSHFNPEST